ncbi:MAG: DUF4149 domain-containing protein [Acidobacteria bacterium]|nr:DUF4149 domain-containing protein [Acidobacteriota bacterium]
MLALRFAALLMLVVWIGGLVALGGVAAPSIFEVLDRRADGRLLAGAVFGETLRRFHLVTYLAGTLLILTLIVRRILGPRPMRFGWRLAIAAAMLATTIVSGWYVAGRIARLQQTIGAAPSSLPAGDPRRAEFGRLHAVSTGLQLVPLLGGLALMYWELKE